MQSLDSRNSAGTQTPFDDQHIVMDVTEGEGAMTTASKEAEIAEAALRRRARRFALFLMLFSSGCVIAVVIAVWLVLFA